MIDLDRFNRLLQEKRFTKAFMYLYGLDAEYYGVPEELWDEYLDWLGRNQEGLQDYIDESFDDFKNNM